MIRVVAGICIHEKKILMGCRLANDGAFGSHWEFPGGKREEGEKDEEALKREFKEELGVEVTETKFFQRILWQYPEKTVELMFYFVKLSSLNVSDYQLDSHSELKWVTKEEALSLKVLPANLELIKQIPVK